MDALLIKRHGIENHRKLKRASVAVAGLGGLGSHVAIMLARAGIGHLHLVDFDQVEGSNLNRQFYKIKHLGRNKTDVMESEIGEINPYIQIRKDTVKVNRENAIAIFAKDSLICEAFDNPKNKAMPNGS